MITQKILPNNKRQFNSLPSQRQVCLGIDIDNGNVMRSITTLDTSNKFEAKIKKENIFKSMKHQNENRIR